MDLSQLSDDDLKAISAGDVTKVSDAGLRLISGKPASVQAGQAINQIPRQLGLTARYAIEGLSQIPEIVTEPIRQNITDPLSRLLFKPSVSDLVTGKTAPQGRPLSQEVSSYLDKLGFPKPDGANERVIGDATRMGFGSIGMSGASNALGSILPKAGQLVASNGGVQAASGVANKAVSSMGANPLQQAVSAVGAGGASGASREAGGSPAMQVGAALLGGVAAPAALGAAQSVGGAVKNFALNRLAPDVVDRNVDNAINLTLQRSGINWGDVDASVRQSVRNDVKRALSAGENLNGDALRRLIEFRRVGATPTAGALSLDPVQITREKNLAKMGANTSDASLQRLAQVDNQNNATFIGNLNDMGAGRGNSLAAGEALTGAITGRANQLRSAENAAWQEARNSPGYRQPIGAGVLSDINRALDEGAQMPFMDQRISNYMAAFQNGQRPFTPQDYRNLQSMLAAEISKGGNEGAAARTARNVLEQAQLRAADSVPNPGNLPIRSSDAAALRTADAGANDAISSINRARSATRAAYAYEDSSPLVRSVLSDGASSDPARIAQRFIIGGTPNEAANVADQLGAHGRAVVRDALVAHLKSKALSGAADEVGNFSQSSYNRALSDIGDRKLSLFFTPEEVQQLHSVGRVASYTQVQPRGSAVNNSNSGAMLAGNMLDLLGSKAAKLPLGLKDTVTGTISGMQARRALTPANALTVPTQGQSLGERVMPGLFYANLLAAPPMVPDR